MIEEGGWENPKTSEYFVRYVKKVVGKLKGDVRYICTINEANMGRQVMSVARSVFARMQAKQRLEGNLQVGLDFEALVKGGEEERMENKEIFGVEKLNTFLSPRTDEGDALIFESHAKARAAIKEIDPAIKVGITLSLHDVQAIEGGEAQAADKWYNEFSRYVPYLKEDDFFGLQNYTRELIDEKGAHVVPDGAKLTQMGYEYYPDGLEHVVHRVYDELGIPILITENGIGTTDDKDRVSYVGTAMEGVQRCKKEIPLLGYLYWSLLDNFEWQKGFQMQFGLVAVDRKTMARTPKPSLYVLGSYAKQFN